MQDAGRAEGVVGASGRVDEVVLQCMGGQGTRLYCRGPGVSRVHGLALELAKPQTQFQKIWTIQGLTEDLGYHVLVRAPQQVVNP